MTTIIFDIVLFIIVLGLVGWIVYNFGKMKVVSSSVMQHPNRVFVFDYFGTRHLNERIMRVFGNEFSRYGIYNNDNIIVYKHGYLDDNFLPNLEGYPVMVIDCFPEKMFCLGKYVGWCTDYDGQIPKWNNIFDKYRHRIKISADQFITQMRMEYSILADENNFFNAGDMAIVEMYDGNKVFYKLIPAWKIYGIVERVQNGNYNVSKT